MGRGSRTAAFAGLQIPRCIGRIPVVSSRLFMARPCEVRVRRRRGIKHPILMCVFGDDWIGFGPGRVA